jgi:peptidase E
MKLLLASNGLTSNKLVNEFKKLITKSLSKIKVLMITTGPENNEDYKERKNKITGYVYDFEKPLIAAGIPKENFTVLFMNEPEKIDLDDFDVVFVCGGNTYLYLFLINKLRLNNKIKEFVKNGGLYIGVSAGSILAGPSIESAGLGRVNDENIIGIKNLTGLGLVNFTVFPHLNEDDETSVQNEIKKAKLGYPCILLNDGEAVLFIDNKYKIIK